MVANVHGHGGSPHGRRTRSRIRTRDGEAESFDGLLDQPEAASAILLFSIARGGSAIGADDRVMRVVRDDLTELDIFLDPATNKWNFGSIDTFIGVGGASTATWDNQPDGTFDITNATKSEQPLIATAGTVLAGPTGVDADDTHLKSTVGVGHPLRDLGTTWAYSAWADYDVAFDGENSVLVNAGEIASNNFTRLAMRADLGGDPVRMTSRDVGAFVSAATTASSFDLAHMMGVRRSPTSLDAYLNGANKGSNTTEATPVPALWDNFQVGSTESGGGSFFSFPGVYMEVLVQSNAPSDADVLALSDFGDPASR